MPSEATLTRNVLANLPDHADGRVIYKLTTNLAAAGVETFPVNPYIGDLDENGTGTHALPVPTTGAWAYEIQLPDGNKYDVTLAGGADIQLATLLASALSSETANSLSDSFVLKDGDIMTGQLNFSGTDHAGLKLLSLTTAERDALTEAEGMVIYNETSNVIQGYQDGAWVDLGSGGGPAGQDADYIAYEAAMSTAPSSTWETAANQLFVDLKAALGVSSLDDALDYMYILAAETEQAALLNAVTPGTFNATNVNAAAFVARRGITGNGSSSYLNTNYTPSTQGVNHTQNSASIGIYSRTNSILVNAEDCGYSGFFAPSTSVLFRGSGNATGRSLNAGEGSQSFGTVADSLGLFCLDRSSSNLTTAYHRGAALPTTDSTVSTGLPAGSLYICCESNSGTPTGFSTRQYALAFAGRSMTATEQADFYTAVQTFMAAIGAAVDEPIALDDLTDVTITTPANKELMAYDSGSGDWINQTAAEAGVSVTGHTHSYLANIVEDTTPQLGGNLDLNGNTITGLVIGTDIQAYSAKTAAIAALTWAANNIILLTGTATAAVQALAAHVVTFIQSASAADARTAIGAAAASDLTTHEGLSVTAHGGLLPQDTLILSKSATYEVAAGDAGKTIECSGTFTVTFPNSLDAGFQVTIVNVGSGTITLSAATTLQGVGTQLATQYTGAVVYHRGSNVWLAMGKLT